MRPTCPRARIFAPVAPKQRGKGLHQFADLKPRLKPVAVTSLVVHATPVFGFVSQSLEI
jgi:hypothetical protein